MTTFEFLKYDPTPKEEKYMGVACIRVNIDSSEFGRIILILRYKIQKAKNGGYFVASPSIKMDSDPDEHIYSAGSAWDSNFIKDEVDSLIRKNIKKYIEVDTKVEEPKNLVEQDLPF